MYYLKKCKECGKLVHAHKKGSFYILKNCCEHIPEEHRNTPLYDSKIRRYF